MSKVTHSLGAAFTVSEKSSNTCLKHYFYEIEHFLINNCKDVYERFETFARATSCSSGYRPVGTYLRPRGFKTFSMLNSAEHEIYPAHKC